MGMHGARSEREWDWILWERWWLLDLQVMTSCAPFNAEMW
jgi:hypothetical protein